jgi:AraC-like DNA-binding protein
VTFGHRFLVDGARAMMRTSPARPLSSIARTCGVSRCTLNRAFHTWTGETARDARRRCFLDAMTDLIRRVPPLSSKQLAEELGFASPQSMARWIQRESGLTPTALRTAISRAIGDETRTVHAGICAAEEIAFRPPVTRPTPYLTRATYAAAPSELNSKTATAASRGRPLTGTDIRWWIPPRITRRRDHRPATTIDRRCDPDHDAWNG